MLLLTQPIWLFAMAGIAIPVILHLWNNKPGKVLAIGSLSFLEKSAPKQSRTRRLTEWLLLLLRCLLLLLAALLLAGPLWRRTSQTEAKKGWVLVSRGGDSTGAQYAGMIDSLVKTGYEKHIWGAGNTPKDGVMTGKTNGSSYWSLFNAADREAPGGIPFYIFTDARASHFFGPRPFKGRMVHWLTYAPGAKDTLSHWVEHAWSSPPDSIGLVTGSSGPTGTRYTYEKVAAGSKEGASLPVDTTILRIQIYTESKYSNDSRYLVAALRALEPFTHRKIQVSVDGSAVVGKARNPAEGTVARLSNGMGRPDWVFWLSSQPVPEEIMASNLLYYQPGKEIPIDSWITAPGVDGGVMALYKRIVSETSGGKSAALWKDGFGRPLLEEKTGKVNSVGRVYRLFSHFDPSWNGLVWSSSFPVLLEGLLLDNKTGGKTAGQYDRRVLDPGQIAPLTRISQDAGADEAQANGRGSSVVPPQPAGQTASGLIDLAPACWVLLLLLFIVERFISFKPGSKTIHG